MLHGCWGCRFLAAVADWAPMPNKLGGSLAEVLQLEEGRLSDELCTAGLACAAPARTPAVIPKSPLGAMRQLLLFRTGCHGLPVDLGKGSGAAGADRACM